jgi:predicted small lipoprotein YifL
MFGAIREFLVTASPFLRLALVGVLALSISGCGRKGALDPPPRASAQQAPGQEPGQPAQPGQPGQAGLTEDEYGNPVVSQGRKKPFLLDAILN